MENLVFRLLRPDEIECRVGTVVEGKGISLLMYKNARVDMQLLDEVVGCENWQRTHEVINGNLFCTVSIRSTSTGDWVSKQDVGTESYTEKEKGQASDAFKRACFNFGIGRELYTCPFVWINLAESEWRLGSNGKRIPKTRFSVSKIEYDEQRRVSYLCVVDDKGAVRYTHGKSKTQDEERQKAIEAIKKAKTREEIAQVYNAHQSLHNDQALIDACVERTKELKAA